MSFNLLINGIVNAVGSNSLCYGLGLVLVNPKMFGGAKVLVVL